MNSNIADPKALGFGVFGIAAWMSSVIDAGIVNPMGATAHTMGAVMTIAMLGLLIAGIAAFLRKESWLGFFFLLWAGFAWGAMHMGHASMGQAGMRQVAWFWMAMALVNFYLWFAVVKGGKFGWAVPLVVLLVWLSFLAAGLRGFFGIWVLTRVSGALGLAAGLVAFYVSAGALAAEHCPNMKLPGIGRGAAAGHHEGSSL